MTSSIRHVSRIGVADWLREHRLKHGEWVWNTFIQVKNRRLTSPLMWTSWLANVFDKGPTQKLDPGIWVGGPLDDKEVRLYLRKGETFLEDRCQYFVPPVEVSVKDEREFACIKELPRDQWWQASFCCPFCGELALPEDSCPHVIVSDHWVPERFQDTPFGKLFNEMRERRYNCNLANCDIKGLRIKIPRDYERNCEWFRSAYWYISNPTVLASIETILRQCIEAW